MSIEKLAEDAKNIRKNLLISIHRETIETLFESKNTPNLEDIKIRLIVIDSLFSTHSIQARPNSLYELAHKINDITNSNDDKFCEYAIKYLEDQKDENNLFDSEYGRDQKREHSFISKYCFFVTKNQFPIIDKFIRLFSKFRDKDDMYTKIKKINETKSNLSYDDFDAIAWIYGKIHAKKKLIDNEGNDISDSEEIKYFIYNVKERNI